jgi:MoxR-like ATPase
MAVPGAGVSMDASLPPAERLLMDFVRLVADDRADEAFDRLQKVVGTTSGRRKNALSEAGRAALSLALSERRLRSTGARDVSGAAFRAAARAEKSGFQAAPSPSLGAAAARDIERVIREHQRATELASAGLSPTRTILLSGPPGSGKTMTMIYLASALRRPLVRLEPSHVIGSYLGESARSLVEAFATARSSGAVLGLDEIDALAKRRDDTQDVGEFKRFVSTLLLELDRWDGETPVIAATNHLELLDPALDRRFALHVRLAPPGPEERAEIVRGLLDELHLAISEKVVNALVSLSEGLTGAIIRRRIEAAARRIVIDAAPVETALLREMGCHSVDDHRSRALVAAVARDAVGMSLRQIGELLDCSHTAARRLAEAGAREARTLAR